MASAGRASRSNSLALSASVAPGQLARLHTAASAIMPDMPSIYPVDLYKHPIVVF